jgi:hypothetical protein
MTDEFKDDVDFARSKNVRLDLKSGEITRV